MASDLKFEFLQRWSQLGRLLFPNPTPEQLQFIQLHEERDRDEEDYLNNLSSGGGTAQSLLSIDTDSWEGSLGNSGGTDPITIHVDVPADASFTYWVEITAHVQIEIEDDNSGTTENYVGFFCYIREGDTSGVPLGWGHQGLFKSVGFWGTPLYASGDAHRLNTLTAGTSHDFQVNISNIMPPGFTAWSVYTHLQTQTKLLAIPV